MDTNNRETGSDARKLWPSLSQQDRFDKHCITLSSIFEKLTDFSAPLSSPLPDPVGIDCGLHISSAKLSKYAIQFAMFETMKMASMLET
jgi:hypothetical protein